MDNHFISGLGIGGFIFGLIGFYLRGLIAGHFKNKNEVRINRRKLATQILSIIAEAETSNYQKPARGREHVKNLAIQAGPFHTDIDDLVRQYEFTWWLASDIYSRKNEPRENLFFYRELESKAAELAEKIKEIVGKWVK